MVIFYFYFYETSRGFEFYFKKLKNILKLERHNNN